MILKNLNNETQTQLEEGKLGMQILPMFLGEGALTPFNRREYLTCVFLVCIFTQTRGHCYFSSAKLYTCT